MNECLVERFSFVNYAAPGGTASIGLEMDLLSFFGPADILTAGSDPLFGRCLRRNAFLLTVGAVYDRAFFLESTK